MDHAESVPRSLQVRNAAKNLLAIEGKIRTGAAALRDLLLQREILCQRHGIESDAEPLALDLWALLDRASEPAKFESWRWQARDVVDLAESGSIPSPELEDVLLQLAQSPCPKTITARSADDQASLQKKEVQRAGDLSDERHRFFGQLDRHRWFRRFPDDQVSALDCMTGEMVAPLLLVAYGRDPFDDRVKALSVDAVTKALSRYISDRQGQPLG